MTQQECAEKMNVVRTSIQATYASARKKLADMLVNGKLLIIEGATIGCAKGAALWSWLPQIRQAAPISRK